MNFKRSSGVLLHPTSLPGKYGIGTLGEEAYKFVDFLIKSKQKLWQVFPLGPTGYGDSPYQCFSAFAGNPLLIDLEKLVKDGYLGIEDLSTSENFSFEKVEYGKVIEFKTPILKKAFENFENHEDMLERSKFEVFCSHNSEWLEDYSLFRALKDKFDGKSWQDWDNDIKLRKKEALNFYTKKLSREMSFYKFNQYIFFKQWFEIKSYANENDIKVIGDIPIFISLDSSDAWANPELFYFDKDRKPVSVAGVPPDYFSETGQLWGNPLYNWEKLKETNFKWWVKRVEKNLQMADIIRVDHFRGFSEYWSVPSDEKTAINGEWIAAPGKELFETIKNELGKLPIIAEDLGVITPDVEILRDHFQFPGMKILQFAFDPYSESTHLPHTFSKNTVVYTGTHDNETILGWFHSTSEENRNFSKEYLNIDTSSDIAWQFIQASWSSVSNIAIAPMQDLLCLGNEARMNTPAVAADNWQWRFQSTQIDDELALKLKKLTTLYFR